MPVRRIGLCYRSVGGWVPMGAGRPVVAVESTLERDFVILQRFDPDVASVEEQPVRVEYRCAGCERRAYVPDFLVTYRQPNRPPRLVEVKHSADPVLVAGGLEERFAAARNYAEQRGWTFEVATEKDIRLPRLANATFLLPFRDRMPDPGVRARVLAFLRQGASSVQAVADGIAQATDVGRAQILPTLWTLVAGFHVAANLDRPLTMNSLLHRPEGG